MLPVSAETQIREQRKVLTGPLSVRLWVVDRREVLVEVCVRLRDSVEGLADCKASPSLSNCFLLFGYVRITH